MDVAVTLKDVLANSKKAVVAGAGAGLTTAIGVTWTALADGKIDATEVTGILSAFVASFVAIGYATYKATNKPLTGSPVKAPEIDPGAAPDPSADDLSVLEPDTEVDTDDIEPVTDGDDGLDEPKHLA